MRSLLLIGLAAATVAAPALAGGGGHKGGGGGSHSFSRSNSSSFSHSTSSSSSSSTSFSGGRWGGGFRSGGFFGGNRWNGIGWNNPGWNNGGWSGGEGYRWDRYYRPERGFRLPGFWLSPTYVISDWGGYGLSAPTYGNRWVRYFDDAVLIDERGNIVDARYKLDWGKARAGGGPRLDYDVGYDDGYDAGYDDGFEDGSARPGGHGPKGGPGPHGPGPHGPGPQGPGPHGPGAWGPPGKVDGHYGFSNGSVIYAGPGVTTVVVQSQPVVTVTTSYETVYAKAKPKKRAIRRWSAKKPRCSCK